ncbi:A24 family peptidase [Enterovibrio norvegicus]|uniref:Prepilin peptidase n=1 Tax=Enterovibrio norvegicus TaxID=188144 RepID=A0ABV4L3M9_9GAMM|nr:prepilin peptidase [Enterovibrio norvegicus]
MFLDIVLISSSIAVILSDVRHRRISNVIILVIGVTCILMSVKNHLLSLHFYQSISVLLFGLILFRFGILAAGDSKLLAVYSIVIDPSYFQLSLILTGIIGGVLATVILIRKKISDNKPDDGVPYGIPIVISGLMGIYLSKLS